MPLVLSEFW